MKMFYDIGLICFERRYDFDVSLYCISCICFLCDCNVSLKPSGTLYTLYISILRGAPCPCLILKAQYLNTLNEF